MTIIQEYLSTLDSTSTHQAYQEDLNDFATWFEQTNGQTMKANIVTSIDLREYKGYMITVKGLKPSTINRRLAALKGWLKWAKDNKIIDDLPGFPRRAAEVKQAPKALSKIEESRLIRAVEREGSNRDKALIALLLYAGLRVGEAVRVRTADIEISERKGKVVVRAGKGQKRREVPLSSDARAMIKPWWTDAKKDFLFYSKDGHITERAAQQAVKKYTYLARLDIQKITPHTLRHTFATRLLRSGVDIVIVAALLGHSRLDTTAKYTQPGWNDLERAIEV